MLFPGRTHSYSTPNTARHFSPLRHSLGRGKPLRSTTLVTMCSSSWVERPDSRCSEVPAGGGAKHRVGAVSSGWVAGMECTGGGGTGQRPTPASPLERAERAERAVFFALLTVEVELQGLDGGVSQVLALLQSREGAVRPGSIASVIVRGCVRVRFGAVADSVAEWQ